MDKFELRKILLEIDEEAALTIGIQEPRPVMIVIGGAAFVLRDLTKRPKTHDVDILHADDALREILASYPAVNSAAVAYADQIPYNFEDRLEILDIGARAITFATPSTEDLVVMKLYAERPNDVADIDDAASQGRLNWDLLATLVLDDDEAKASALAPRRYREMVGAYERFCKRNGR